MTKDPYGTNERGYPTYKGWPRLFINRHQWKMFENAGWDMSMFILQHDRIPVGNEDE